MQDKHFRPIMREKNGPLRRLTNAEISNNPQYGDYSPEQSQMTAEDFYDRMDDTMSPEPLDPLRAMTDAITSLTEQIKTRVTAVENGRKWQAKHADMRKELQSVLDSELATRKVSYTRSDGSEWTLSVKDVVDRAVDFEMAYNPNDCVERLCCRAEANYRAPDLAEADCRQYSHGGSKGRSLRLRAHGGKRCSVSTKRQRDV